MLRVSLRRASVSACLAISATCAFAQNPAQTLPTETLNLYLQREVAGVQGRAEVKLGQIDPRLTLAPCQQIEPYLPAGAKLWGRSNIGLRCKEGANWKITVPVEVRVFAQAWVANRPIPAQTIVSKADFSLIETEVTREPGAPVQDVDAVTGKQLARPMAAGAVLRLDALRAAPVVAVGDAVRVVAVGRGFSIQSEGEAMSSAIEGQTVRVKMDGGRVISGVARPNRVVELAI
jgi:flagellar basal body P-ring formation protein FlgA